jgi:hypothetical protein
MKTHFFISLNNLILKAWEPPQIDMAKVVCGLIPDVKSTGENGVHYFG